jgi:hypothetical protein
MNDKRLEQSGRFLYFKEHGFKKLVFGRAHKGRAFATRFPIKIGRAQTRALSLTQAVLQ